MSLQIDFNHSTFQQNNTRNGLPFSVELNVSTTLNSSLSTRSLEFECRYGNNVYTIKPNIHNFNFWNPEEFGKVLIIMLHCFFKKTCTYCSIEQISIRWVNATGSRSRLLENFQLWKKHSRYDENCFCHFQLFFWIVM